MGLAVLPARLAKELVMLEKAMLAGEGIAAVPELASHVEWANKILADYPDFAEPNARRIIEKEVGRVFMEVLEDAGVFKRTEDGRSGFMRFVESLRITLKD